MNVLTTNTTLSSLARVAVAVFMLAGCSAALLAEDAKPQSKVPTKPAAAPSRVLAAHILVSHAEAQQKPPTVTRTKEEARARADEALAAARKSDAKWEDVVNTYSDDARSVALGGKIGIIQNRGLRPEFQALGAALFGMEVGQVSDVVESPLGFHVLTRFEIIEYAASHILIQYKGSQRAGPEVTRSKEDAEKLATELTAKAKAEGADFGALAREHSDGPSGPKGGALGIFSTGQMVPAFEAALARLKVGEIAGPVETGFGYHVIKRDKIERVEASHILIGFQGTSDQATRTKEEALELATKVRAEAVADGADFAELARKYSEGPSGPGGGSLGEFGRGRMVPPFDAAVFALEVAEVSEPVLTQFGYHIILRTK